MRAIMALGLAWSILVCATPGLADRFGNSSDPAVQPNPLSSDPASIGSSRQIAMSDGRVACRPVLNLGSVDGADQDGGTGSIIPARYDPATDNPLLHTTPSPQFESSSTGLCR